jgi:uncharacterized protein (TIGR02145 family)
MKKNLFFALLTGAILAMTSCASKVASVEATTYAYPKEENSEVWRVMSKVNPGADAKFGALAKAAYASKEAGKDCFLVLSSEEEALLKGHAPIYLLTFGLLTGGDSNKEAELAYMDVEFKDKSFCNNRQKEWGKSVYYNDVVIKRYEEARKPEEEREEKEKIKEEKRAIRDQKKREKAEAKLAAKNVAKDTEKEKEVAPTPMSIKEGTAFETVTIGDQEWMKHNLNYEPDNGNSWCYKDEYEYCEKYGRLYDWATAMAFPPSCNTEKCTYNIAYPHRGICPEGWHIPSDEDWNKLENTVGHRIVAGMKLKAKNEWGDNTNKDDYGFSALPGGMRATFLTQNNFLASYQGINGIGTWWSASEPRPENKTLGKWTAFARVMTTTAFSTRSFFGSSIRNEILRAPEIKDQGFSVRCLKD